MDGAGHVLRDYILRHKASILLFIAHPNLYDSTGFAKTSRYELYKNGVLLKAGNARHYSLPENLLYVKDFLYTLLWQWKLIGRTDLFFGVGNLNALDGLLLRFLGRTNKVIYYVVDYVPVRFLSPITNFIYHAVEKWSAYYANATWNLSPRMIEGREKKWGISFPHQLVVPHGVYVGRIKRCKQAEKNKNEIMYLGALYKNKGVQLVIEALPDVLKKIPTVHFTVIGSGPYEDVLIKLVQKYSVGKQVTFLGHMTSQDQTVQQRVSKASVAVALYSKKYDQFAYYADPSKVKNYLGSGLPVITTDVPYVAQEIAINKCGYVIPYSKKKLVEVLIDFFSNEKKMVQFSNNALKLAKLYEWDNVFNKALKA